MGSQGGSSRRVQEPLKSAACQAEPRLQSCIWPPLRWTRQLRTQWWQRARLHWRQRWDRGQPATESPGLSSGPGRRGDPLRPLGSFFPGLKKAFRGAIRQRRYIRAQIQAPESIEASSSEICRKACRFEGCQRQRDPLMGRESNKSHAAGNRRGSGIHLAANNHEEILPQTSLWSEPATSSSSFQATLAILRNSSDLLAQEASTGSEEMLNMSSMISPVQCPCTKTGH